MKKIRMVLGVARSGTSILFHCLAKDKSFKAYEEGEQNRFFRKNCRLHPMSIVKKEIGLIKEGVLLRPIFELEKDPALPFLQQFSDYDMKAVWVFRDPVNVYYSHVVRWGKSIDKFLKEWSFQARSVLDALKELPDALVLVRHENLVRFHLNFIGLCSSLDVQGQYLYEQATSQGRRCLGQILQRKIDEKTKDLYAELNKAAKFKE